jgi:hypothetical protein
MSHELRYHPSADQLALANTYQRSTGVVAAALAPPRLVGGKRGDVVKPGIPRALRDRVSEDEGGSGLGAVEETLIAMALGRVLRRRPSSRPSGRHTHPA